MNNLGNRDSLDFGLD